MAETMVRPRPAFGTYFTRDDTGDDDDLLALTRARSARKNRLPQMSGLHDYRSEQVVTRSDRAASAQFRRPASAAPHREDNRLVDTISGVTAIGADFGAPPIVLPTTKSRPLSSRPRDEESDDPFFTEPRAVGSARRRRSKSAGERMSASTGSRPTSTGQKARLNSARQRASSARLLSARSLDRQRAWEEQDEEADRNVVSPIPIDRALTMPPSLQSKSTPSSARPYSSIGKPRDDLDELSKKYIWTSSTKQAFRAVNWEKKLPQPEEAPNTTVEELPDPVSQRWTIKRYEPKPAQWQSVGLEWDKVQTRETGLTTHPTNFTSPFRRNGQIPGYTGQVGSANNTGDADQPMDIEYKPIGSVTTSQPWYTGTARRGNIPAYTGCVLWNNPWRANQVNRSPWHTTSARVHRVIPNEEPKSPFSRTGILSRTVTLTHPYNPFNQKE